MTQHHTYQKFIFLFLAGTVLFLYNCTTNTIDEGDIQDLPPIEETVTYDDDVAPIIASNCIGCHSGPNANAGLDLSNYANVRGAAEQGNLVNRINNGSNPMPPSGILPPETRQIIDQWIADGYLEN
ncbi:c-type cytochrome [Kordia jejudonensis]|uniref:c-type cytochrome n=1 Tax=Kordia jejudonensis TaxID=1348245 RepID=UPI000699B75B|nr:cytochrome c [Kordia jejudonensis]